MNEQGNHDTWGCVVIIVAAMICFTLMMIFGQPWSQP